MTDKQILEFVYGTLNEIHGEPIDSSMMQMFKEVIDHMKEKFYDESQLQPNHKYTRAKENG